MSDVQTEWALVCLDCEFEGTLTTDGHPHDHDGPPTEVERTVTKHKGATDESHIVRIEARHADQTDEIDPSLVTDGGQDVPGDVDPEDVVELDEPFISAAESHIHRRQYEDPDPDWENQCTECGDAAHNFRCQSCGLPLCSKHNEMGAGFCSNFTRDEEGRPGCEIGGEFQLAEHMLDDERDGSDEDDQDDDGDAKAVLPDGSWDVGDELDLVHARHSSRARHPAAEGIEVSPTDNESARRYDDLVTDGGQTVNPSRAVLDAVADHTIDRGAPVADVVSNAAERIDITPDRAEEVLDELERRGEVYRPGDGLVRVTPTDGGQDVALVCRNDGAEMQRRSDGGYECPDCEQVVGVRVEVDAA
ncbi:hypothetical protein SAMN04487947_1191 [Halogeometricum rufum]|uniref:Uncharacterized protein n=1 Tax=Halogeometricum rufum TaxID=553469 RepID=A0A1I6GI59_9EURY|nr:hypothetical protein [Halogeometricum rufum]SFR41850.1 hypothetical protein SAMN04487947_1191 [Halogeometricum rufum]